MFFNTSPNVVEKRVNESRRSTSQNHEIADRIDKLTHHLSLSTTMKIPIFRHAKVIVVKPLKAAKKDCKVDQGLLGIAEDTTRNDDIFEVILSSYKSAYCLKIILFLPTQASRSSGQSV